MLGCPQFIGFSIKLPKSDTRGSRRKCHALLARLEQRFNPSFPAPLDQQSAKKCRLQSEDGQRCKHKAPMLLPEARRTKADFAFRRQPAFVDSEALELSPVKYRPGKITPDDNRDLRGVLAAEDTQRELTRCLAHWSRDCDKAPGTAVADIGFHIDHDRAVGHFGN